jgi:hypothetical protein
MTIEWLLMAVISSYHANENTAVQQIYSTQAECEAGRKIWDALTLEMDAWVKSLCVKKVKT